MRKPLRERVIQAAEMVLAEQQFVAPIDVLAGIGWIDSSALSRWRQGRVERLEDVVQTSAARVAEALNLFEAWARAKGLVASEAQYLDRSPAHRPLHFSHGGDQRVEARYRTHWLSSALPEKRRERLIEKANQPPELVVIQPLNHDWKCHRCASEGGWLMMEPPGPACLACVGLDELEFLAAGDVALTRRAKAKSARYAVVVRFSRSRGRYERQGLLLEPAALQAAKTELSR